MSVMVQSESASIEVPAWVHDLTTFHKWIDTEELPEKLPVHFLNGHVWVDFSMEEFFSHNRMKTILGIVLAKFIEENDLGTYVGDGMRYSSETVGFSTEPDAMYFSHETFERGEVELRAGKRGKATELVGTPDLVIEIVSPSTEEKDTDWLFEKYYLAGIPEYWLIDARSETIRFDLFKPNSKGYTPTRKSAGWLKSNVLGKSFKLTRKTNRSKLATYQLEMR